MPHPPDANPERTGNCHVSAAFFSCIRLIRASRGPDMPICGAANMRAGVIGFYLLVCPLGGIVLSGCWPYSALATPDVHMRVVEANTLRPIEGAVVTIISDVDPEVRGVGRTDSMGMVRLPALDHAVWALAVPMAFPASNPYPVGRVTVEAPNYQPLAFRSSEAGGAYIVGAQPVVLMPASGTARSPSM
jgi:hypothetical protein